MVPSPSSITLNPLPIPVLIPVAPEAGKRLACIDACIHGYLYAHLFIYLFARTHACTCVYVFIMYSRSRACRPRRSGLVPRIGRHDHRRFAFSFPTFPPFVIINVFVEIVIVIEYQSLLALIIILLLISILFLQSLSGAANPGSPIAIRYESFFMVHSSDKIHALTTCMCNWPPEHACATVFKIFIYLCMYVYMYV